MNLETLASVCSGLEVDFSRENTVSLEMGTVETRSSKTLALSPETDKTKSPREKTLDLAEGFTEKREGSETVIEENHAGVGQENGVRDLGETKVTGKEEVASEKGLVEENGISLGESKSKPDEDEEVEDKGDEGDEFFVGDFVWGKIKSHPWWPGQINDPSNASEFAAKIKHKGKHLVAYFGDGTFAWCHPSQLKPFEENFDEMSKQSGMKTFVGAVQQAVDEIRRVLELKMTCLCVPEQNRGRLVRLVAENAGVKDGSLVPEGKIRKFSNALSEPSDLLDALKGIAQATQQVEALELGVLMSRVSAFYRAKGVCKLPRYHDPVPVPGLEDNEKSIVEIPAQGPFEDWLPLSVDVTTAQANQPLLQSCVLNSDSKKTPRRKQRSIADLIAADGTTSEKKASPSGEKKRKLMEDLDGDDNENLASLSGKAKKTRLSSGSRGTASISNIGSVDQAFSGEGKEKAKEGVASNGRKTKKKDATDIENEDDGSKAANSDGLKSDDITIKNMFEKSPSFRERKKSKYLSPPFTDVNTFKRKKDAETEFLKVSAEDGAREVNTSSANQNVGPEKLNKRDITEHGPGSPKHKTPVRNQDKISGRKKADVSTNEVLSEVRSAAADPFTQRGKKSAEMAADFMSVFRDSVYCNGSSNETDTKPQSRKRKRKTSESESGSHAKQPKQLNPKSPKANQSSASDNKSEGKKKVETRGRKRKQETATPEAKKKDKETVDKSKGNQVVQTVEAVKSRRDRRKRKQETTAPEAKETKDKDTIDEKILPATLIVEFAPASTLPTKADLIKMYGKYGELDEIKTDMYFANQSARIYFLNGSNAELAYKDSKSASPFGSTTVEFILECPSHEYKTRVLKDISNKSPGKGGGEEPDLGYIRRKLETISSMLEEKDGKMSQTMNSKLKGEISGLLERVSAMVGSSSSS